MSPGAQLRTQETRETENETETKRQKALSRKAFSTRQNKKSEKFFIYENQKLHMSQMHLLNVESDKMQIRERMH